MQACKGIESGVDPLTFLAEADIENIAQEMDSRGYGVWRDVIPVETIDASVRYIERELLARGGQYFGLSGTNWIRTSPLASLGQSETLHRVLTALLLRELAAAPRSARVTPSLRVLAGTVGQNHSFLFHYDSFVVTALVPLIIPDGPGELRGDLILYPALRRLRHSAVLNILEKSIVEAGLLRPLWRSTFIQRRLGARVVRMEPGNIYFFWGMRSLHGNRPCALGAVRSTALFHFGDPHAGSFLKRLSARRHEARLRRLGRSP